MIEPQSQQPESMSPSSSSLKVPIAHGIADATFSPIDLKEQNCFVTQIHEYIDGFIKFADQKAAFIFAGASGFLALIYNQGGRAIWHRSISSWNTRDCLACASMLLAAGSAGLAVAVVGPRLRGRDRGLIYWGSITRFRNPEEYRAAIGKLDLGGVTNEITEHCFELSRIAERKYALLTWAIWAGILGLAIGSLYLL